MSTAKLVVGSDSLIGGALLSHFRQAGGKALSTTRRPESVSEFCSYLDLSGAVEGWQCPSSIYTAVVCAGATKLEECASNPVGTSLVNVDGVSQLVKSLVRSGAFVIYLSSNRVFNGAKPHQEPDDPLSPITEYGRQKAEAERLIRRWGESVAIVRLTKVLGFPAPLFTVWRKALENREPIHPYSNTYLAPIPISCVISVISMIADKRLPGIWQVSGDTDVSYADAAMMGARKLGLEEALVQPVETPESMEFAPYTGAHTTLNIDRLNSELGIVPPDVRSTIEMAFAA